MTLQDIFRRYDVHPTLVCREQHTTLRDLDGFPATPREFTVVAHCEYNGQLFHVVRPEWTPCLMVHGAMLGTIDRWPFDSDDPALLVSEFEKWGAKFYGSKTSCRVVLAS